MFKLFQITNLYLLLYIFNNLYNIKVIIFFHTLIKDKIFFFLKTKFLTLKFYYLWNGFTGNKAASLGKKSHQKPQTKEFQKVQASPEEAQEELQMLTPTVLSNTTTVPREKPESHGRD